MLRISFLPVVHPRATKARSSLDGALARRLGISLGPQGIAPTNADALVSIQATDVADDLAVIVGALLLEMAVPPRHGEVKLRDLVCRVLDRGPAEADLMIAAAGALGLTGADGVDGFYGVLIDCVRTDRLHALFYQGPGTGHRGVHPSGRDSRTGSIDGATIATWRATYRSLAPEQQMMAATMVWLYQSGPDSTWLRRVPCSWGAVDAIRYLQDAGAVARWLRLIALYPGW